MNAIRTCSLVCLVVFSSAAVAAPHSLTYSQVSVAPGTIVNIGGTQFVAVQVPVREFSTDKRYAVRWLSQLTTEGEDSFVFADLITEHSTDPLENPNATIDGLPARIDVSDGRTYSVRTVTDFQTFNLTNRLQIEATATVQVQVKAGDTRMTLFLFLTQTDQDVELGVNEYRGTAQAAYGKYTDPLALIGQASGLDKWIDYIRVIPLN